MTDPETPPEPPVDEAAEAPPGNESDREAQQTIRAISRLEESN